MEMTRRKLAAFLATVFAATIVGCGGPSGGYTGPTGTVSGTLKSSKGPIPPGTLISFELIGDRFVKGAEVGTDGSFKFDGELRTGTYIVVVAPPMLKNPEDPAIPPPQPQEYPGIPAVYRSGATSSERQEVKAGVNQINIELK